MKYLLLSLLLSSLCFGATMKTPSASFVADGGVTDLLYKDSKLYASTSQGSVNVFDISSKELVKRVKVPNIKDFMGDEIAPKIYTLDINADKMLLLSQGDRGYGEVYLYENDVLTKLISSEKKLSLAKAKFIDKENILLALLGNELISYNILTKKYNYRVQVSQSKFSSFALNEDKTQVVTADESGDLHLYTTKDAKLLKTLTGQNLDNVFAVDFKNKKVATAGQDRRAVIYDLSSAETNAYYKASNFLIYSVGLSPSAKFCAYASDEKNNASVFNTNTKSTLGVFTQNKMTISKILFINENEFFIASDDKAINLYKLK